MFKRGGFLSLYWNWLERHGFGAPLLRWITHFLAIILLFGLALLLKNSYFELPDPQALQAKEAAQAFLQPEEVMPSYHPSDFEVDPFVVGLQAAQMNILRLALPQTVLPNRPRLSIVSYVTSADDTLFSIAEKFNLLPESVLWANPDLLKDDPHLLKPGQELNIVPANGTTYQWHAGDSLPAVAQFFSVSPEAIWQWPGNRLSSADAQIPNGTVLFIPGGKRTFTTSDPPRLPREKPDQSTILGNGGCGKIQEGTVGTGVFIWPTQTHRIAGYAYVPNANHFGIDIEVETGQPVFSVDGGVVVYAGWNNWGYGNLIVIDHGNGWQSLYGHLSGVSVVCGQSVYQGDVLGTAGDTGNTNFPNLHFELMSDEVGRVDPRNFLPQ